MSGTGRGFLPLRAGSGSIYYRITSCEMIFFYNQWHLSIKKARSHRACNKAERFKKSLFKKLIKLVSSAAERKHLTHLVIISLVNAIVIRVFGVGEFIIIH